MMKLLNNIILAIVALVLGIILMPTGIFYAVMFLIFRIDKELTIKYFERLFMGIALSIDELGNFTCAVLFNHILLKDNYCEYRFGKRDSTISSSLGVNLLNNNLNTIGLLLAKLLDLFEKDHCIKSIVTKDKKST